MRSRKSRGKIVRDLSRWKPWIYIKIVMQWDWNGRGCLDAITNYHRVSSRSKYWCEARTKSCMPIGIILVIGFVVSRNIHRCGVRLLTSLVFVRDKTPTIRSPVFPSTKLPPVLFLFSTRKSGRNFFTRNIKPRLRSIDPPSYSLRREMR